MTALVHIVTLALACSHWCQDTFSNVASNLSFT